MATAKMKVNDAWGLPDRYEVRELLGSGSYGQVRAALDKKTGKLVAVKRIPGLFDDATDSKRVLREIAILKRLSFDLIVAVKDLIRPENPETFSELLIVFEHVPSDIRKLIRSNVWLSETHVKAIMYNMLNAMNYVHSAGVYHRDLKPANCLINEECIVKICDFGLARVVDGGSSEYIENADEDIDGADCERKLQKLTSHVVTRWYRAPEVILLNESYNEAVDVWSMGCIMAELLQMIHGNTVAVHARSAVFPGGSCFPLSPDRRRKSDYKFHAEGGRDQVSMIFNVLGTPSPEDLQWLERSDARKYLQHFTPQRGQDFKKLYPKSSDTCLDMMKAMLTFNPKKRITVGGCLSHPWFEDVRVRQLEKTAPVPIKLPFPDHADKFYTETELRALFLAEIDSFHNDRNDNI